MPKVTTGITATSAQTFLVDAGALWLNLGEATGERLLGASRGGATFEVEQEIREIEVDGARGPLLGARRVVEVRASITCNLMELTTDNIMLALAGSETTVTGEDGKTGTTHDEIKRSREIGVMDYLKNVALVGSIQGTEENFVGIIYNALADETFSVETSDKDESVIEIKFKAHFDPAKMNEEPWAIRIPKQ